MMMGARRGQVNKEGRAGEEAEVEARVRAARGLEMCGGWLKGSWRMRPFPRLRESEREKAGRERARERARVCVCL